MMKKTLPLTISIFIACLVCLPAFVFGQDWCTLKVETVDFDTVNKNQIDPNFLTYLEKYKRGVKIIAENLPSDPLQFTVVIERPLFKEGFLGYTYKTAKREYKVTREEIFSNQKLYGSSEPIIDSIVCAGYLPGEKINLYLSGNNKFISKTAFIPNPLEKVFSDGKAKISLEYLGGQASRYAVIFSGFDENEEITFYSISGTEELPPQKLHINNMLLRYSNGVIGADGGKSIVTISRESGESVTFVLPWGKKLIPYIEGKVAFGEMP